MEDQNLITGKEYDDTFSKELNILTQKKEQLNRLSAL